MSRRPPARWGGNRDNKGPAGTLWVPRATRLGSGIVLVLLFTLTQARTQKMVGERKTRGGQQFLWKLLGASSCPTVGQSPDARQEVWGRETAW